MRVGPAVDRIARLGFAAKGMIALMIGALGLRLALGWGRELAGPKGALVEFFRQPFGRFTVAVIAVGLFAHAIWKLVQALLDPEEKGTGLAALAERASYFVTALGYALLGYAGIKLLLGQPFEGMGGPDAIARSLLGHAFGRYVVGLVGAIVLVSGVLQLRFAAIAGFRHIFPFRRMHPAERALILVVGCLGYVGLGVMSCLIGWSLLQVAITFDPAQADGWREALGHLASLGRITLGVVASALMCYGLYFVLQVHYREL